MNTLDFSCSKTMARYTRMINEGCIAKISGLVIEANPYKEGTPEHQAWAHGWERA
jgi:hypothetical protein